MSLQTHVRDVGLVGRTHWLPKFTTMFIKDKFAGFSSGEENSFPLYLIFLKQQCFL
jgi:hypothetical protein